MGIIAFKKKIREADKVAVRMNLCHVTAKENITHLDSVIRMLFQFCLYFGVS